MNIYDKEKHCWYEIVRSRLTGRLSTSKIIYVGCIRAPTPSDLVYENGELSRFELKEPPTPQPIKEDRSGIRRIRGVSASK